MKMHVSTLLDIKHVDKGVTKALNMALRILWPYLEKIHLSFRFIYMILPEATDIALSRNPR